MSAIVTDTPGKTLTQRVFLHYSECSIEYHGLRILEKTPTNKHEYTVRFEELASNRFTFVRYYRGLVIWAICCVLSLAYLLFALTRQTVTLAQLPTLFVLIALTIGSVVLVWLTRREYIGFGKPGTALLFRANKPSRQAVTTFLHTMLEAKKTFLRDTYLRFDGGEPSANILNRLLWLQEQEAITAQEFEALKAQHVSSDARATEQAMGFVPRRA